ncbi:MAG: PP2C family protein-serine/threonine phosphatase, partial [Pseudonocardiales bacterium]
MTALDPHDRPVGRLLRANQSAEPDALVETLSLAIAGLGGTDVVLYLVDYAHAVLMPHPDILPHGEKPRVAAVDGSMAGRAFVSAQPLAYERDDGWEVWVPVTERVNQLGVLAMRLPAWNEALAEYCVELGHAAAHLIVTSADYTDLPHLLRRRQDMDLAAEMQWSLLPPVSFATGTTHVAGLLEPAYEVGGDCFDYAYNRGVLDVAVFDAVGHGLASAVLGSLLMGAYRHGRRNAKDLPAMVEFIDESVRACSGKAPFATGLLARLEVASGQLSWISAGHPQPIIVRRGSTLAERDFVPALPLGLGGLAKVHPDLVSMSLEPGDGVLLYTDGVVEARSADGQPFGEDRLRDLVAREHFAGGRPQEVVRRLVRYALEHTGT